MSATDRRPPAAPSSPSTVNVFDHAVSGNQLATPSRVAATRGDPVFRFRSISPKRRR